MFVARVLRIARKSSGNNIADNLNKIANYSSTQFTVAYDGNIEDNERP